MPPSSEHPKARTQSTAALSEDFLPRLVHELRSPAHAIQYFLETFEESLGDIELPSKAAEDLAMMRTSATEMKYLLRSVARFAHAFDTKQITSMAVADFVDRAWAAATSTAIAPVSAEFENACGDVRLQGDNLAFDIALQALFDNALRFHCESRPLSVVCTARTVGDRTTIEIVDNGRGIEVEYLQKCYEPFERLHPRSEFPGGGLGIPTAMQCIAHMGGRLTLESDGASGTKVRLEFDQAVLSD